MSVEFGGVGKGDDMVCCFTSFSSRKMGTFFLLQTNYGNILRIVLKDSRNMVSFGGFSVSFFAHVAPCSALCILRSGFVFCAGAFGDHILYKFAGFCDFALNQSSTFTRSIYRREMNCEEGKDIGNLVPV